MLTHGSLGYEDPASTKQLGLVLLGGWLEMEGFS
jgi:hypothetical protein